MDGNPLIPEASHTTSAHDEAEGAKLKARLRDGHGARDGTSAPGGGHKVPSVQIDVGAHKYALVSAREPDASPDTPTCNFVVSKAGAAYHCNAAEPLVDSLEESGYTDIRVTGGGRIYFSKDERVIKIFGYSYGFGMADHALSKKTIEQDGRFSGYDVTCSNDGY